MFNLSSKFQAGVKSKMKERRWWLCHAMDFRSLMYPCFTFCRILGIPPYKFNPLSFEISKPYYILSTITVCVFYCYLLIVITNIPVEYGIRQNIRKIIEFDSFYILGGFVAIVSFVLNGPRMRLLRTIQKISSRVPSEMYQKQSVLIHIKDIFGFLFLLTFTLRTHYILGIPIWLTLSSLYICLLTFLMDMLYINCVCVLKICFKEINDDLANLLVYDKLHLVKGFCQKQRNPLLLMRLKALEKQHLMVSHSVQMLNIIFTPQLLATIVEIFTHITFALYFNMVKWENGLSISWTNNWSQSINILILVVYFFIKIILIAWACETSKNEAVKICTTVHDVLNSTNDEQIKDELHLFSLQIMHCDNTFSAKGVTLDATLLTTIMGVISTYLLILIQFLIGSHSCDGKIVINVTQTI